MINIMNEKEKPRTKIEQIDDMMNRLELVKTWPEYEDWNGPECVEESYKKVLKFVNEIKRLYLQNDDLPWVFPMFGLDCETGDVEVALYLGDISLFLYAGIDEMFCSCTSSSENSIDDLESLDVEHMWKKYFNIVFDKNDI